MFRPDDDPADDRDSDAGPESRVSATGEVTSMRAPDVGPDTPDTTPPANVTLLPFA